jgi:AbrB family looped-hinge helix DNA binding protein
MKLNVEFTRPSASGQVVIPQSIRKRMNISPEDRFMVVGDNDTILFKRVNQAAIVESFSELSSSLQKGAKEVGLTRKDVADAIKWARARK